jgi:hypothetical protein
MVKNATTYGNELTESAKAINRDVDKGRGIDAYRSSHAVDKRNVLKHWAVCRIFRNIDSAAKYLTPFQANITYLGADAGTISGYCRRLPDECHGIGPSPYGACG